MRAETRVWPASSCVLRGVLVTSIALPRHNLAQDLLIPVETHYGGCNYDCSSDARWALFWAELGISAHYYRATETEDLVSSLFLLNTQDTYVVIVPRLPHDYDIRRVIRWVTDGAAPTAALLFGLCDYPWQKDSYAGFQWFRNAAGEYGWQRDVVWRQCVNCGAYCLAGGSEPCADCGRRGALDLDTPRLVWAYDTAALTEFQRHNR